MIEATIFTVGFVAGLTVMLLLAREAWCPRRHGRRSLRRDLRRWRRVNSALGQGGSRRG